MIKNNIPVQMVEKRMSQKELSDKTGITPTVINKYYHDKILRIPVEHLDKFCEIFNCQISDLMEYIPD